MAKASHKKSRKIKFIEGGGITASNDPRYNNYDAGMIPFLSTQFSDIERPDWIAQDTPSAITDFNPFPNVNNGPVLQGAVPSSKQNKKTDYTPYAVGALAAIDAAIPKGKVSRKYVRPEQQNTYNPNAYGTGSQAIMKEGGYIQSFAGDPVKGKKQKASAPATEQMPYAPLIPTKDQNPFFGTDKIPLRNYPAIGYQAPHPDVNYMPATPMTYGLEGVGYNVVDDGDPYAEIEKKMKNMADYMRTNNEDSNVYRAKWQHLSAPTNKKEFDRAYSKTGDTAANGGFFKKGQKVTVMSYENGGVSAYDGGTAKKISYNPIDGGMGEFKGQSHANGGIQASFGGKPFEAEGGEPYRLNDEGDLEIFGALKNPVSGNTFKKDAKQIAKQEVKTQKYIDLGTQLIDSTPESKDKFELLKFNSGTAMLKGGVGKQKQLAQSKEQLSALQNLMLMNEENQYKAKHGGVIPFFEKGGKMYKNGGVDPREKFEKLRLSLIDELQKKYPGKPIKVEYNKAGKQRGLDEQAAISTKNKYSPEFGMHNLDAARDFNIFIDGKPASKSVYKETLHPLAKQQGLFNLSLDSDPYHISLVQEGKGKSFSDLVKTYPGYLDLPEVKPIVQQMTQWADAGNLSKKQLAAFKQLTGAKGEYDTTPIDMSSVAGALKIAPNERLQGENIMPIDEPNLPVSLGGFNNKLIPQQKQVAKGEYPSPNEFNFTNPSGNTRKINQSKFPWQQAIPAIPALTDRTDPVLMQQFTPELYSPYQVSFQDRRNRNTSELNATRKAAAYDPSALGVLGAQAYQANEGIDAEEFRTNQGIFNDVNNKNIALLNDAKFKNLGLADQQFVRQETAKGNTRDRRTDALSQIVDIKAKHDYENKALAVSQNLYKDYTYDENGQLQYQGPSADQLITPSGWTPSQVYNTSKTIKDGNTSTTIKSQPLDYIETKKTIHKNGGKVTQSKLAKLMYS